MQISYNKPNVSIEQLTKEINSSQITISLDHIVQLGPLLNIVFKANISVTEEGILADLVENHVPQTDSSEIVKISEMPAIASKRFQFQGSQKNLFKRVHGIRSVVAGGAEQENFILFTCPYPWAKFLGLEFFGGSLGDYCSLEVFDDALGSYTGTPNQKLNQFGFDANIAKDYYLHRSEFDADIYLGMLIKVTYTTTVAASIGINIILNEVKDIA